ncbi:hypothetical protein [Galactobacillus timonensis]|uniref:hypothetical protein n=1 Tax=Galactobacillus timonensis TaxID=2041840 RepID=UPI00240A861C|nr:hypothetical protein [Galactobacillus timonensis]MDD5851014.1 hypothetical protein [Galactobacillus timonensis]
MERKRESNELHREVYLLKRYDSGFFGAKGLFNTEIQLPGHVLQQGIEVEEGMIVNRIPTDSARIGI